MAATTTLKLPEELKARIASAAQVTGKQRQQHDLFKPRLSIRP